MLQEELTSSDINYLQKHRQSLLKLANKVFGRELATQEDLAKKLPLLKWKGVREAPGAFSLYLLCSSEWSRRTVLFAEEMLMNWLVPNKQLKLLSSRNLDFQLPYWKTPLFFVELLVHIPDEKTLRAIQKRLPGLADGIKLGSLSSGNAKHVLEMKRLSLAGHTSYIYDSVAELIRRYPKRFSHDIFREIQHFLAHCRKEFREIRDHRHLCRIICAHYLFQKAIEKDVKLFPHSRHLYLKLMQTHLHYPFGLKKVLGIAICLNSLQDYESFELRHILKAIQRLIPHVRALQESYYAHRNEENNLLTIYLEIEKTKGEDFTLDEIKKLKDELTHELKNSIEYLSPSLFIPRNEEELIRNIINLSQELKFVRDLPQAIISFQEQHNDLLRFNIILLRILNKSSRNLAKLSRLLPPNIHFIPERVANVGYLRKKYIKEANVFSLEIENQLFLRKNHSVDLVKARQYVVKAVEKMVGPFRDYNGGFLFKQNEQLEAIKEELGPKAKQNAFLLENLFYSLTPSIMQTYIAPEKGKVLCSLFLEALQIELPNQEECLKKIEVLHDALALVIKSTHFEIKERLSEVLKQLEIDPLQLAAAYAEVDGFHYHCYLYLNPTKEQSDHFIRMIDNAVSSWLENRLNQQVLHLHLPRAAQSLDPRIGADRTSGIVIKMLYEGLMRFTETGQIEPAIASSYTFSEDKKTFRFHLRKSFWSNGAPLTAYDFEYAWKKILEPDFRFPYSFLFFPIKNAEAVKKGEIPMNQVGVRALDEQTLFVELEFPFPAFPSLAASWVYSPLCREIDQKHPGWAYHSGETYVCNGPFKLDLWKLNDDLQVVKNPNYWDASSVKLDRIQLSIINSEKTALDLYVAGELDWVGDPLTKISPHEIPPLKKKGILESSENNYGLFWIQLNYELLPFQSAPIRKAFAYSLNRKELIDKVLSSNDTPAYGFAHTPPNNERPPIPENDPELARFYFQKGLEELGLTLQDLPTIVITHSEIEEQEAISREVGRQWEETLGVKVAYERILWNTYFEVLHRGDFMVGGLVWYPRYDHPSYFYDLIVYREHTLRTTTWKNPRFSRLIHKAKHTDNLSAGMALLQEAEKILIDEMPIIPLFYQKFRYVKNPRLQGCILSNTNQIDFRAAYLENTYKETHETN
ncbi:MAG: peptide ABC transporter substrate-binding protein [Chlamydiales bacterium]|nr:peptide ABC transporter substrate-binding protein [Chlamydiales bacterium]